MLGDTAVAVHPDDERYRHLIGQMRAPAARRSRHTGDRATPTWTPSFGSGCVKITPAHDFNDYEIGQRHGLPMINVMTLDAALNDAVPAALPRSRPRRGARAHRRRLERARPDRAHRAAQAHGAARRPHPRDARAAAHRPMVRATSSRSPRPRSARSRRAASASSPTTGRRVLRMDAQHQGLVHQPPALVGAPHPGLVRRPRAACYVARSEAEARAAARPRTRRCALRQDEDVLDTWFSSGLWPFSTQGWPADPGARRPITRPRCWSRASTSFSSGSRA